MQQYNISLAMINMKKNREATLIVKANSINWTHLPSAVVADYVLWWTFCFGRYSYSMYPNKRNTTLKHKVSRDKTELKYGGNTCCKIGIS